MLVAVTGSRHSRPVAKRGLCRFIEQEPGSRFVLITFLTPLINLSLLVLVIWGKKFRCSTAPRCKKLSALQFNPRSGMDLGNGEIPQQAAN